LSFSACQFFQSPFSVLGIQGLVVDLSLFAEFLPHRLVTGGTA